MGHGARAREREVSVRAIGPQREEDTGNQTLISRATRYPLFDNIHIFHCPSPPQPAGHVTMQKNRPLSRSVHPDTGCQQKQNTETPSSDGRQSRPTPARGCRQRRQPLQPNDARPRPGQLPPRLASPLLDRVATLPHIPETRDHAARTFHRRQRPERASALTQCASALAHLPPDPGCGALRQTGPHGDACKLPPPPVLRSAAAVAATAATIAAPAAVSHAC